MGYGRRYLDWSPEVIIHIVTAECDAKQTVDGRPCPRHVELPSTDTQLFVMLTKIGWEIRLEGHGADSEVKTYCPDHARPTPK